MVIKVGIIGAAGDGGMWNLKSLRLSGADALFFAVCDFYENHFIGRKGLSAACSARRFFTAKLVSGYRCCIVCV